MSVDRNDVYKAMWWLEHQRIFFFGAFIIGTTLILTLKSFDVNNGIISALAVMLMLGYAATGIRNRLRIRLDVLGDNLYYLGFLYTLVSLSYSLYTLGKGTADINNLLENFGLAIMTTLCGLALRVFFNQPKADISEYEHTIRLSLTEATANFIAETSKIGTDISTLRTVLSQVVQETQDAQRMSNQALSDAVNDQIMLLDRTSSKNQENIESLLKRLETIQNNFAENFDLNTKSMKKVMTASMNQIEKGAESFTGSFENISASVNELKTTINLINGIIQTWDSTVEKLLTTDKKIQDNLRTSSENLSKAQSNFTLMVDSMPTTINKAIANFETGLATLAQKNSLSESQLEQSWQLLNSATSKITSEIRVLMQELESEKAKLASLNNQSS